MPILSKRSGQDERAALFPPELLAHFDGTMIASFDLYEEYVSRLALVLFRTTGLEAACRSAASATEAVARAGLVTHAARVPASWILALLASRDWIAGESGADGQIRYHLGQALPFLDPEELRAAQQAHDPRCLPAYDIAMYAIRTRSGRSRRRSRRQRTPKRSWKSAAGSAAVQLRCSTISRI